MDEIHLDIWKEKREHTSIHYKSYILTHIHSENKNKNNRGKKKKKNIMMTMKLKNQIKPNQTKKEKGTSVQKVRE